MAVHVAGLISVIVFYIIILVIGIIASRKTAKTKDAEEMFVANRNLSAVVTFFTLSATMVGGGFINGTAEAMAFSGLLWTQAPIAYALSMIVAAIFYARTMREREYITMFDPFQRKYGMKIGALLFLPQLLGDVFWGASILAALGSTLSIILDINRTMSIIVSAVVAVAYTFFGGLYAVAYTDIAQYFFVAIGLYLAFPFGMLHEAVDFSRVEGEWLGDVSTDQIGVYIEIVLLLIFGAIPWQVYYQRVLACKTPRHAMLASLFAAVQSLILSVPPLMIGYIGRATDWSNTSYNGTIPIPEEKRSFILPMVLQYLCPVPIAIIGMGAVAGAVMSSSDSGILSCATIFTQNIYRNIVRVKASKRELVWILRLSIVFVGVLQTIIAITAHSVYGLFVLCSDLMYVIMFPQLTLVLYFEKSNSYGCLAGYLVGFVLRIGGGEPVLQLPAFIHYPYWSEEQGQLFPFRTFSMVCGTVTQVVVSVVTHYVFTKGKVKENWDILRVFRNADRRSGASFEGDSTELEKLANTKM